MPGRPGRSSELAPRPTTSAQGSPSRPLITSMLARRSLTIRLGRTSRSCGFCVPRASESTSTRSPPTASVSALRSGRDATTLTLLAAPASPDPSPATAQATRMTHITRRISISLRSKVRRSRALPSALSSNRGAPRGPEGLVRAPSALPEYRGVAGFPGTRRAPGGMGGPVRGPERAVRDRGVPGSPGTRRAPGGMGGPFEAPQRAVRVSRSGPGPPGHDERRGSWGARSRPRARCPSIEERPGSPGARRAPGGLGGPVPPSAVSEYRGAARVPRDTTSAGGLGGPVRVPPIKTDVRGARPG